MSFISQICLTNIGTTPLGSTLYAYSDYNSFLTPFNTNLSLSDIIGGNCPYDLEVPNGTTIIRLYDPTSGCYCEIPISSSDICTTCDINFNEYSASTVGRIVAGNITGSCDASIDDYVINWIGPSPSTDIAYISGKGSLYQYNFTHPLTGNNAIFAQEGIYTPVIDKIKINDVEFSQSDLPNYVTANLECFNSINIDVSGFTCDNGGTSSNLSYYEHRVNFLGASNGLPPQSLQSTFILSATTNYFAWRFQGFSIADTLKLTFIGSAYSDPIILEYWTIGNTTQNFSKTVLPDGISLSTQFAKITTLTGLTVNNDDRIVIEVIPNQSNPQTNWDFYFTCLETFNCDYCPTNKTPLKIIESTISNSIDECNRTNIQFKLSGCTTAELQSSDLNQYILINKINSGIYKQYNLENQPLISATLYSSMITCSEYLMEIRGRTCVSPNTNYIRFEKSIVSGEGLIQLEFSHLSDLNAYYNSYIYMQQFFGSNDNTDISYSSSYYDIMRLVIPQSPTSTTPCGDGVGYYEYKIHHTSIVTTGDTGGGSPYTMSITMPTIIDNIVSPPTCSYCSPLYLVNDINLNSTGTTNNRVVETNVGSRFGYPFNEFNRFASGTTTYNSVTPHSYTEMTYASTSLDTYPVSGTSSPYTLLPQFSGTCCPNITDDFYKQDYGEGYYKLFQYSSYYRITLTNPSVLNAFKIEANVISSNGNPIGPYVLVYEYDGTSVTYTNPTYLI